MGRTMNFWERASTIWDRIGSPFRPDPQDLTFMHDVIRSCSAEHGPPRALVLGVTPGLARLEWPAGSEVIAVDASPDMIGHVWPGLPDAGGQMVRGDWLGLPLRAGSFDLVLSDGPWGVLRYPDQHRALLDSLRRVLRPGGLFASRAFLQPDPPEDPAAVYADAVSGRIATCHAFRFRLLMAVQRNARAGARMGDAWTSWFREGPDTGRLAAGSSWTPEEIESLEFYHDNDFTLTCPTLEQLQTLLDEEGFEEVACRWPEYELGERCPTLVCRPGTKPT